MDQEANTGNHGEHGQGETIQYQAETDVEIADRHPGPQRQAERLLAVVKEVDTRVSGDQRSQADRADAHGGRQIFRPATTGESQQHKADQRENNG
ncbi:hypothetical protein D3C72_2171670 [compost metagenome]